MTDNKDNLLSKILDEDEYESEQAEELLTFIETLGKQLTKKENITGEKLDSKCIDNKSAFKSKKLKRTYYIQKKLVELLTKAEKKLKDINKKDSSVKNIKITKSKIVNLALELLLNDFIEKGETSFLVKRLFDDKGDSK